MARYKLTLIGLAISVSLYLIVLVSGFQMFEAFVALIEKFEKYDMDEILIPLAIFMLFAFVDQMNSSQFEKLKILKAMLFTTHHIVNNFINQMQLFRLTAENTPGFDPKVLALYDQIINDAALQIDSLGGISNINEASIHASVLPQSKT